MTKTAITNLSNRYIAEGRIKEALQALSEYVKGRDRYMENDLLMQTASFNRNSRDFSNNIIDKRDYDTVMARLNYALTNIMERLPENGNEVTIPTFEEPPISKPLEPKTPTKRKILFLTANPQDTGQLNLGVELRKVKDGLSMASRRDDFDLESESAVRISTITRAMQVQRPEIVHFSGHGTGIEGIVVENDAGESELFPTAGLDRLFRLFKKDVKCVLLNACYSKEQAEAISQHGIHVVGMNTAVGDKAAIDFSVGFYQSIGEGNDFSFAFEIAMVNISTNIHNANTPELWLNGEKIA